MEYFNQDYGINKTLQEWRLGVNTGLKSSIYVVKLFELLTVHTELMHILGMVT